MKNTRTQRIILRALGGLLATAFAVTVASSAHAQMVPNFGAYSDLGIGSRGTDVSDLQGFLNEQGFMTVAPTGYFGPITQKALAAYQGSVGINATGKFDQASRASISSFLTVALSRVIGWNGTNLALANTTNTANNSSNTTTGYWYNGVWYPTSIPNIGGNGNIDSTNSTSSSTSSSNVDTTVPYGVSSVAPQARGTQNTAPTQVQICLFNGTSYYNCHY